MLAIRSFDFQLTPFPCRRMNFACVAPVLGGEDVQSCPSGNQEHNLLGSPEDGASDGPHNALDPLPFPLEGLSTPVFTSSPTSAPACGATETGRVFDGVPGAPRMRTIPLPPVDDVIFADDSLAAAKPNYTEYDNQPGSNTDLILTNPSASPGLSDHEDILQGGKTPSGREKADE